MQRFEYCFKLRKCLRRTVACLDGFLRRLHLFGTAHVSRILSGESKLCQAQRIGTVGGGLSGRDQFVRSCYRIVDLGYDFQDHIFRKGGHLRPVLDVRTEMDLFARICHTMTVKNTVCINIAVKMIGRTCILYIQIGSSCQIALICRRCSDGAGIHKSHRSDLTALKLTSLTIREVSGRMTDTESIVGRSISCAETGTTECRFHDRTGLH